MFYYFTILTSIFLQVKTNLRKSVKSMKILQYSYSCVLTEKNKKSLTFPLPERRDSSSACFLGSTLDGDWREGSMVSPPKG